MSSNLARATTARPRTPSPLGQVRTVSPNTVVPRRCACADAILPAGHLQIGGGITADNAREWLDAGASKAHLGVYAQEKTG